MFGSKEFAAYTRRAFSASACDAKYSTGHKPVLKNCCGPGATYYKDNQAPSSSRRLRFANFKSLRELGAKNAETTQRNTSNEVTP